MRYKIGLLLLCLACPGRLLAQSYEKEFGVAFAWEVKQVDEFIERFNNDESSFIQTYLKKKAAAGPPTREKMLKSLFNAKGTNWNYGEITAFIKQVSRADHPQYLNFDEANWFAKVRCQLLSHGKPAEAALKLSMLTLPDGSCKWVITDVEFLGKTDLPAGPAAARPRVHGPVPPDPRVSLNPMSYAIDFMNIDLVTKNPANIENFVSSAPDRSRSLELFIDGCLRNQFKIVRATSISYTFLQIDGWLIEVRQFNRASLNSGWLISKLVKLS
ncbi:MAG: hypothetical protein EOO56_24645 [Hymenobacter sp.]|nr:MAG: hypothetical protein EOO56_24645 [Hymenobacter sp.]